jgi:hypothetical protein
MQQPNRPGPGSELAEARERIGALTGLLDAVAALADLPMPADYASPSYAVASQSANDHIAVRASGTAAVSTAALRDRTEAVAEKAARPLPYTARENETFGAYRAAYLAGRPQAPAAEPEAQP